MNTYLKRIVETLPAPIQQYLRNRHYARKIVRFPFEQEPDLAGVKQLVLPGMVAFDIGANAGVYTRFLSEWVGRTGSVCSFEPVPETWNALQFVVNSNGMNNVQTFCNAVSDSEQQVTFTIPNYEGGSQNTYMAHIGKANAGEREITVHTITLDAFCKSKSIQPQFIKIDVEGHELAVLRGAKTILQQHPLLFMEVSGNPDEPGSARDVFDLLASYGYRAYWWANNEFIERKTGDQSANYFFRLPPV